jgi:hypothetical protein
MYVENGDRLFNILSAITSKNRAGDGQPTGDSVGKVGLSACVKSSTATTGESTHHFVWFLSPALTFATLLLG